eukprot:SAG22_NODE_16223_length_330_cov_1.108225_1_plen_49_part_10
MNNDQWTKELPPSLSSSSADMPSRNKHSKKAAKRRSNPDLTVVPKFQVT